MHHVDVDETSMKVLCRTYGWEAAISAARVLQDLPKLSEFDFLCVSGQLPGNLAKLPCRRIGRRVAHNITLVDNCTVGKSNNGVGSER